METKSIPNIQIVNVGTGRKPQKAIKGFVELPCWTDYFLIDKPNYLIKEKVVKNGRIELWVDGEINADGSLEIDQEQVNSYIYLLEHQDNIKKSIVQNLKLAFPHLLEDEYGSSDHEQGGFPMLLELTPKFDFKNYIGPASISILEDKKDEAAYIRWHFRCLWDPEHGFEVITHKDRVIDISPDADIFKIYKDNDTYEEVEKELNNKEWKLPKRKKWWQFW
ncbi:MAG TPA: hypothetical protein VM935_10505 [Chitinophagaceae bacterium]|jgi:hypothetical protein|nr:hypothetical protein [Chitinophagaceae bacterium]